MTTEELWYASYQKVGTKRTMRLEPPRCTRWSRLPMEEQWSLTIDLAISCAEGFAGYRNTVIVRTGEQYWYFPHPLSDSGWWLIPYRIVSRIQKLERDAIQEACRHKKSGSASAEDAVRVLEHWKRTRVWFHHVWHIIPRHPERQIPKKGMCTAEKQKSTIKRRRRLQKLVAANLSKKPLHTHAVWKKVYRRTTPKEAMIITCRCGMPGGLYDDLAIWQDCLASQLFVNDIDPFEPGGLEEARRWEQRKMLAAKALRLHPRHKHRAFGREEGEGGNSVWCVCGVTGDERRAVITWREGE